MKMMRKILCLLTVLCLLCTAAACGGGEEQPAPGYRVKVVDALGDPYTEGVVVQFMQNGAAAGMQAVDAEGVAAKGLPDGDYTVALNFTSDTVKYHYDESDLTLSADKKELTVTLAKLPGGESDLTAANKQHKAYSVETGCTYVTLTKGERNYFLFRPSVAGKYEFSMPGSDAVVGYYGNIHIVQPNHLGSELVDGKFTLNIKAGNIDPDPNSSAVWVLGVDAGDNTSATLAIRRIGEPDWGVEDEPWTTYKTTSKLESYTLPAGASLKTFDLTADSYELVKDDKGWYHLNSATGPLVLMRLGVKSEYLDDFKIIVEKSHVCKYFYDEDGKFLKKESYNECLLEYMEVMDEEEGVYPLTDDLKYIIQQRGDHYGWFDAEGGQYLFKNQNGDNVPGINAEISWLFPCCYIG